MKTINTLTKAVLITVLFIAFSGQKASAATFTAVANGNWTSSATWGGTAPAVDITAADNITIPLGITVTMNSNVTVNNSLATLTIAGGLNGNANLTIANGNVSQTGSISVNTLTVGATGQLTSSGSITVNDFINNQLLLALAANITVNNSVTLNTGVLQLNTGGLINLANNATINIDGGSMLLNGGSVNIVGAYNLAYSGTASAIGLEASLTGLHNVTINLSNSSSQITLTGDLTVTGTLQLQQGSLNLNGHTLTIDGTINTTANAGISGNASSNIAINGSGNIGTLGFSSGSATIGNLTVNIAGSGSVDLSSDLDIDGNLTITNGSLNVGSHLLSTNGSLSFSGSGMLSTSATSNISISGSGNLGTLVLSGSGNVGNLSIGISSGGSVSLGSDLTVNGALTINNGTLALNAHNLTLNGTVAISGSGAIDGNVSSDLTINGTGSIGNIVLSSGAQMVHDLTINIASSGTVTAGSGITVSGVLDLQGGSIMLNGNHLTLNGTIDASGSGSIGGSATSSITIGGTGNVGDLELSASANTIGDLTINTGSGGSVSLASDVNVNGTLALNSGNIVLGNHFLTITSSGTLSGGSSTSYVVAEGSGSLVIQMAGNGATANFAVGTAANYAPVVVTNHSTASGSFMANLMTGVHAAGTTGADISAVQSVVNTSWNVETDISSNVSADLEVYWNSSMEVNAFDNMHAYISHYTSGSWDATASAQATAHGGGTFSVKRSGITSFSPFAVFDNNTSTGIAEVSDATLKLYPNPTSDYLYLSSTPKYAGTEYRIFDVTGRLIDRGVIHSSAPAVNVSNLKNGAYFITLANQASQFFMKQ